MVENPERKLSADLIVPSESNHWPDGPIDDFPIKFGDQGVDQGILPDRLFCLVLQFFQVGLLDGMCGAIPSCPVFEVDLDDRAEMLGQDGTEAGPRRSFSQCVNGHPQAYAVSFRAQPFCLPGKLLGRTGQGKLLDQRRPASSIDVAQLRCLAVAGPWLKLRQCRAGRRVGAQRFEFVIVQGSGVNIVIVAVIGRDVFPRGNIAGGRRHGPICR